MPGKMTLDQDFVYNCQPCETKRRHRLKKTIDWRDTSTPCPARKHVNMT